MVCDGRGDIYNKSANCPAVADLNVEWDFQSKTWRAEFVDGDFRGQKRCFPPSEHTDARWEKMQRILIPFTDSTLTDATPATKRKVAKEFVSSGATPSCTAITPRSKPSSASLSLDFRRYRWIAAVADNAPQSRGTRRSRGRRFPILG